MFKEYQEVMLAVDSYIDDSLDEPVELKRGQRGVIVCISVVPGLPVGYHVEFVDDKGETIALPALEEKYLAPVPEDHPARKRNSSPKSAKHRKPAA